MKESPQRSAIRQTWWDFLHLSSCVFEEQMWIADIIWITTFTMMSNWSMAF